MDEIIGAGDAAFFVRAEERLNRLIGQTRILVIASHAENVLRRMCNKAALLHQGRLQMFGEIDDVLNAYRLLG
jgi:ABC-type polysaccharide/polyol phosphate transport system ATPase subunit